MATFAEVKQQYGIEDIANRLGIEAVRRRGHIIDCRCPKHGEDRSGSFYINISTGRAGCFKPGCFEGGDIFALVQWHQNLSSMYEALTWITGEKPTSTPKITVEAARADNGKYQQYIQKVHDRSTDKRHLHAKYIIHRGLPIAAALDYDLGAVELYQPGRLTYAFRDSGETMKLLPATRYLIPWKENGHTVAVKLRLDVESAKRVLDAQPRQLIERVIANERAITGRDTITEDHLIEVLFGGRYLSLGSQTGRAFYHPDFGAGVPLYCCEGEYDCMALTHVLNVPARATKHGVRNHSGLLIYIMDNDKTTHVQGRSYIAGREVAERVIRQSGKTLGKDALILAPPEGYKDIGDMLKAGILHDWFFEARRDIA